MRYFLLFVFIAVGGTLLVYGQNKNKKPPETVKYVDLKKYVGKWYEIAKIPNSFQDDCVKNTTATYSIREDGKITVLNRCTENDGVVDGADGVAQVVDKKTNSKLEVSFVSVFGINLFWGDYWIIGLDENYKYAVIGHPERKYGWILCRDSKMPEKDLQEVFSILREKGYDPKKFEMTKQD